MRPLVFVFALIASQYSFAPTQASAQPLSPQTESIDSLVWNSDCVLIVKIDDFRKTKGSEEHNCYDAQVTVTETLKHPPRSETHGQMTLFLPQAESVLADWKKRQCLLLVALESYAPANTTVIELTPDKMEVMTADFVLLRKSDAVLKAARQAARRQPVGVMRVHTHRLRVPRDLVNGTSWEGSYADGGCLILNVPVDDRLKKRAKSYLRAEENTFKHYEGKEAMRYFKRSKPADPIPAG